MSSGLIYLTLLETFSKQLGSSHSMSAQAIYQFAIHIIFFLNYSRLLWYPLISIDGFETFKDFWLVLSYSSMDTLFAEFKLLYPFLVILIIGISGFVVLFMVAFIFVAKVKSVPLRLCKFLRFLFFLFSHLCFIPVTVGLLLIFKYSNSSFTLISEYENKLDKSQADFGLAGVVAAPFLLCFHYIFAMIYECCIFEISHTMASHTIRTQSTGTIDALYKTLIFIACVLYISIITTQYLLYLIILLIINILIFSKFLYLLPYYSNFMNFLKISLQIYSIQLTFFYIISYLLNNSTTLFVLSFFVIPSSTFIVNHIIHYRLSKVKGFYSELQSAFFVFELSIRENLFSGEMGDKIFKLFHENFSYHKEKSNFVIRAYYASDHLANPMLGLLLVSRTNYQDHEFFSNYQVFKCKEYFQEFTPKISQGLRLYLFILKLKETKLNDKYLCEDLLKLMLKVLERNPELSTIKAIVKVITTRIERIHKDYSELLGIKLDQRTVLDLYSSLLSEILNQQEKAKFYFNKKSHFTAKRETSNTRKASVVQDHESCIMIVSGNKASVGKIMYANQRMVSLLETTEDIIEDCYLEQFIPRPFDINHGLHLLYFIENRTSHYVIENFSLYVLTQPGFIIECKFTIECLGYNGQINFLSNIEPVTYKNREIAIINRNGHITNHTANFPRVLDRSEYSLREKNISDFIPGFNASDIPCKTLWIGNLPNKKKIAIIIKERAIINTIIYLLYLISDELVIENLQKNWNKGEEIRNKIKRACSTLKKESTMPTENYENKKNIDAEETKDNVSVYEKDEVCEEIKKKSGSSSTQVSSNALPRELKVSLNTLRTIKYLILASIVIVIIYNVIFTVYVTSAINSANSLIALNDLGNLSYTMIQIALISRVLDVCIKLHRPFIYTLEDLEAMISVGSALQISLLSDYPTWSFCPESKIINEKVVNYWQSSESRYDSTESLVTVTELFLQSASSFLDHLKANDTNYSDQLSHIIFNGLGKPSIAIKQALKDLVACEQSQVADLNNKRLILTYVAIVILGLLIAVMCLHLIIKNKEINSIWESLRKRIQISYSDFREAILDRLRNYHDQKNDYEEIEQDDLKVNSQFKFVHCFRYIRKIFVFFFCSALLYLITSLVFYEKINDYLYYRPSLILNIINQRIELSELHIYTLECYVISSNASIFMDFPDFYPLEYPLAAYNTTIDEINESLNMLENDKLIHELSALEELTFLSIDGNLTFLSLGTYSGMKYIEQESQFITFTSIEYSRSIFTEFINNINNLDSQLTIAMNLCNVEAKSLIDGQLNSFIYFIAFFSLFLILVYFFYILPFIKSEQHILKSITDILLILPCK